MPSTDAASIIEGTRWVKTRAVAAGPTSAATASSVPRPWAATKTAAASRTSTAVSARAGEAPSAREVLRSKATASRRQ
jgi:hypothetical protein